MASAQRYIRTPFEGVPPRAWVPVVLLLTAVCIIVYAARILPGLEAMQCGPDWASAYQVWEAGPDGDVSSTADNFTGPGPTCTSQMPGYVAPLSNLLPLLFFAPFPFIVLRQAGSVMVLPALLLVLVLRDLLPGDNGIGEWAVLALGVAVACVPIWSRGLVPALAHAGALAIWPTFALAANTTLVATTASSAADWVLELAIWLILPGVLMLAPLFPQRRRAAAE